jgi:NifU-like protein involved in Fe-S cluster formation
MDHVRLRALRDEVADMLRGDGSVTAPFQDYEVLKPAAIYRNRHICILLPIDAALEALEQK